MCVYIRASTPGERSQGGKKKREPFMEAPGRSSLHSWSLLLPRRESACPHEEQRRQGPRIENNNQDINI